MMEKYEKLKSILIKMGSVVIAFSGGVDSTLLLKVASEIPGLKVSAVIGSSETLTKDELECAKATAENLGVNSRVLSTKELSDEDFAKNPKNRCYFCKTELFSKLLEIAKQESINFVVDGSNLDDDKDYRPGSQAKKELGIRSPLAESGFTKSDIRELSRKLGLPTWNKPAMACLSSRIPYGTRITKEALNMIEKSEKFLRGLGFNEIRVRHHGNIARVELSHEEIPKVMGNDLMDKISKELESIGYTYVTIDLKGYRTGSMNEVLREEK